MEGRERHQLVAVDDLAVTGHREHAIAVAVEREAGVVPVDRGGKALDVGRAGVAIDVAPVGLDRERVHLGAEPAEDLRRDAVGGAVRAVEQDPAPVQVEIAEAELELAQVVARGAVQLAHTADRGPRLLEAALDLALLVVAQLHPLRAEELDPVVLVGIVRGRHHRGHVEPVPAQQDRRAGGGQHAPEQRVAAARRDAGGERRLEHLARLARVADDQHLWGLDGRDGRRGTTERGGQLGSEELARDAADAVRPEQRHGAR